MTKLSALILGSSLILSSIVSAATSIVECRNGDRIVFSGLVRTQGEASIRGDLQSGYSLGFKEAITAMPSIVVDRRTLQRRLGVELTHCSSPYARVFERMSQGSLRCQEINVVKRLDVAWNDQDLLALVLPSAEVRCALTLSNQSIRKLR